jgi:hypothetical protein
MDCRVKPCNDDITDGSRMRRKSAPFRLALVLAALTLSACAQRNQVPFDSALNEDDDTFCRAGGKVAAGSAEYAACRKDRDAQRHRTRRQEAARFRRIYAEQSGSAVAHDRAKRERFSLVIKM